MTAFNNWNYRLDPSWHGGILSVRIDAGGINPNDNDIAEYIIKIKEDIDAYLGNEHNIKLYSLLTNHGGGGGKMESYPDVIKNK